MTRDQHPAFGKGPRLASNLWQEPDIIGKVNKALEKYRKRQSAFWKQMERYLPAAYMERLFRQAWIGGYAAKAREVADEAANRGGEKVQ